MNLYAYGKNPISWVDPMGWDPDHGDDKHYMTVTAPPGSGFDNGFPNALNGGNQYASGYSPDYPKGQCCPPGLQTDSKCHTEQKFAQDLINNSKLDGKSRKGQNFQLTGTKPPCPNCHTALMRAAQQTGATITYKFGDKSVTYTGQGLNNQPKVGVNVGSSQADQAFASKYNNIKLDPNTLGNGSQPWSTPQGNFVSQSQKNQAVAAGQSPAPSTGPTAKDYWGQQPGSSDGATKAYQGMPENAS